MKESMEQFLFRFSFFSSLAYGLVLFFFVGQERFERNSVQLDQKDW